MERSFEKNGKELNVLLKRTDAQPCRLLGHPSLLQAHQLGSNIYSCVTIFISGEKSSCLVSFCYTNSGLVCSQSWDNCSHFLKIIIRFLTKMTKELFFIP